MSKAGPRDHGTMMATDAGVRAIAVIQSGRVLGGETSGLALRWAREGARCDEMRRGPFDPTGADHSTHEWAGLESGCLGGGLW